jgi:hypothetical protein
MLRIALLTAILLGSLSTHADEGDLYLDFTVTPQLGWLTHPLAATPNTVLPFAEQSMFGVKPALGLGVRRGVTNELHLGVGVEAAGATSLTGKAIQIENQTGDLLTAAYAEVAVPLTAGWRFDSGYNLTGLIEVQAAPLFVFWGASAFADPTDLDEAGRPAQFPVDIADTWHAGGVLRAQALFEARLWDVFACAVGPSVGVSWADTVGVHVGLVLRPSAVFGGP